MRTNKNGEPLKTFSYQDMVDSIENPLGKQTIINGATEEDRAAAKEQDDPHAGIKSFLFIVFFIGAIISMVVFSQSEPILCVASAGSIFFVIGTINMFKQGISLSTLPFMIVPTAGALMVGIPVIKIYQQNHGGGDFFTQTNVIRLILVCMAVIGFFLLTVPLIRHRAKMSRCSQTIMAKCIYLDIHFENYHDARGLNHNINIYCPTWQYEINDFLFVTREGLFTRKAPDIGDVCEIRYDPADPSSIYRPDLRNEFVEMIIGAAFTAMSVLALFVI